MSYLLFADDNEAMRLMVRDLLGAVGHEVGLAPDGPSALAALREREPELLILDRVMPGMDGLAVCRAVKSDPLLDHIPILILTAEGAVEQRVEGLDAGADDYLPKPFDPRELRARVEALLRLVRREADRNPTTGLPGGRAIEAEIRRRSASGRPFAICYIDLDHFKPFADTFGFSMADAVIRDTAAAIRGAMKAAGAEEEFVGHIGGDDFILVTGEGRVEVLVRETTARFREVVRRAVGVEAFDRGEFTGVDRDGTTRTFPLAALSTAVLVVPAGRAVAPDKLAALAADAKRRAKQRGSGTVVVESV